MTYPSFWIKVAFAAAGLIAVGLFILWVVAMWTQIAANG